MSKYTKQDIIQMVEDEDVEFIRLQFTDMFGTLKNVAVTSSQLEKALNNECMFDGSSIEGFVRIEESDMYLYPDLDTFCIFPWRPQQGKVARIICDIYTADRQPFSGDPRYVLKRAVADAAQMGYQFDVGPECEFFLFDQNNEGQPTTESNERAGYFDLGPVDLGENARRDMVLTLEDMGFYCADNLPVLLIEKFAELVMNGQSEKQDIALGVDVRSGEELPYLEIIIRKWRENKYPFSILFLDSSDEVLIKRFKETRRSHPLSRNGRVEKGIELEREKLAFLKKEADQVIDTSRLLTKELRHELENLYSEADGRSSMFITVVSFGFKYGIPADADLVFDVRFLPNPYYVEELRFHTGTEQAVQDYVMQGGTGEEFLKKLNDLLEFVIPKYEQEGKTQLVIAIGCTGGRHRSVTIAGEVFKRLTESGRYEIRLEHRDAGKDGGK